MKKLILLFSLLCHFCYGQYADGTYCAQTDRYNPRTLTQSSYTQTVEVQNNKVIQLNWPNGGHSDKDDFAPRSIIGDKASLKDDKGILYTVTILKAGTDCFEGSELVQCSGTTKAGNRCRNKTGDPSGRCHFHGLQDHEN